METLTPLAFGFGNPADWMIIMVVALIVFGPKKLPEVGRQLGQAMREFRKMTDELTGAAHSVRDEVESAWHTPTTGGYQEHHAASSPTVEAATGSHVYDQAPEDLMAPRRPRSPPGRATADPASAGTRPGRDPRERTLICHP